jgi:proteic killer suppression protein
MVNLVKLSRRSKKDVEKVPSFIALKLAGWIESVENDGLEEVRKIPGFHDEPLQGDRKGQRSIRLNRSYRAIYEIKKDGSIEFVEVQEVNKHEY